ncbi:Transcription factor bHLH117 [Hirschfeldia incana]|nr:Transcription factor bHLH117 [Hirschfeldia incana]
MESGYEFESLSELPPLPQVYAPMEYHHPYDDIESSLPPFPESDFTPHGGFIAFSDTHQDYLHLQKQQQHYADSSPSLLTRDYLTESTRCENLFSHDVPFLHLPDLKSVEDKNSLPCLSLAPPLPVARHNVNLNRSRVNTNTFSVSPSSSSKSHGTRKVSDRIRSLEKIMPWEKKMSLAAILEETHKYITFLHSQIDSLRWMPLDSVYPAREQEVGGANSLLKSLTRQQILQVIANSPGSRNVLYTQGLCVFSYEQIRTLKMMAGSSRNL